jgi:amino acid adenylation domain-containing protein
MRLVHHAVEASARRFRDKTAVVCGDRRISFGELDAASNRLANALLGEGVLPGDRVAVFLENSIEAVISIFGILKAGAAFTLISATTKANRLAKVLADERASALITTNSGPVGRIIDSLPPEAQPRTVVWVAGTPRGARQRSRDWEALLACASDGPADVPVAENQIGTILYTSGTTGEPKGVVSLHRDMVFATNAINTYLDNWAYDVVFCSLPLAFTYGLYQLITAMAVGATLVLERNFAFPAKALEVMERERVTAFPGIPTLFNLLLRQENLDRYDLSSLRYMTNAAAPMPIDLLEQLRVAFPQARFFSMYGQTECKRVSYLPPEELAERPGSVGRPIPGTDVFIVDPDGAPVERGAIGELVVVGPHVMAGYWEKPGETAAKLKPGRRTGETALHTGDLFRMDEDGYLYFVARADDIINTRGEKVSPVEIENAVRELRGVVDVSVIGVPDALLGEAVKAYVVLDSGCSLTERDVKSFCAQRLEDFKVPRQVAFCAELPRSENGKVLRRELRSCAG